MIKEDLKKSITIPPLTNTSKDDFSKPFKLLLCVSKIFCAAHISSTISGNTNKNKGLKKGILEFLYTCWCLLLVGCITAASLYHFAYVEESLLPLLKTFISSEPISNLCNVLIVIIGCYYHRNSYVDFIQRLSDIDEKLLKLNKRTCDHALILKYTRIFLCIYFGFFLIKLPCEYILRQDIRQIFIESFLVFNLPNMISLLSLTQYFVFLFCIQTRYKTINLIIIKIIQNNEKRHSKPLQNNLDYSENFDGELQVILDCLRRIFFDLDDLSRDLTKSFGLLVLGTVTGSFLILSIQTYYFYKMIENSKIDNMPLFVIRILWCFLHAGKIFMILLENNTVSTKKSEVILQLNNIDPMPSRLEKTINRFLMQYITQNENRTACGVITLDLIFLGSVIGAVATYVIFIIQYNLSTSTLTATTSIRAN